MAPVYQPSLVYLLQSSGTYADSQSVVNNGIEGEDTTISYQYVFEVTERLNDTMKMATEEMKTSQGMHKHYYDKLLMQWRIYP